MSYADTMNRELWGGVSTGQFIGMVIGCAVALIVMCFMGSALVGCLLAALLAYLVPHIFHTTHKQKAIYGVVMCVLVLLLGGLVVGPQTLDANRSASVINNDHFTDVTVTYDQATNSLEVKANIKDVGDKVAVIGYTNVTMIAFAGMYMAQSQSNISYTDFSTGDHVFTNWDTKTLHYIVIGLATAHTDGSGNTTYTVDTGSTRSFTDAKCFSGDATSLCWTGAAYSTAFLAAIFFFIVLVSWFFRSHLKKTRAKMEQEGRLYPQGYGRCDKCGAIVLPGEVECRKCGTYIDRPDALKHKKVEYFRCTNCGSEIPKDADKCPKCGAVFTGQETERIIDDGSIECPDCGASVPKRNDGIRICPRCGRRFQE